MRVLKVPDVLETKGAIRGDRNEKSWILHLSTRIERYEKPLFLTTLAIMEIPHHEGPSKVVRSGHESPGSRDPGAG